MAIQLRYFVFLLAVSSACFEEIPPPFKQSNSVVITSPNPGEFFAPGEAIKFSGALSGGSLNYQTLKVRWLSDKDGVIFEGRLDKGGVTSFQSVALSRGVHKIKLEISNGDTTLSNLISVTNYFKLRKPSVQTISTILTWESLSKVVGFECYEIYRNNTGYFDTSIEKPLFRFEAAIDTTFVDSTLVVGQRYFYQVFAKVRGIRIGSNINSSVSGKFLELNSAINKVLVEAKRGNLLCLVGPTSRYESLPEYGLLVVDIKTLTIKGQYFKPYRFSDLEIDSSGDFLFLSDSYNNKIFKVSLNDFSLVESYNTTYSPSKIEFAAPSRLFYVEGWGGDRLFIYDIIQQKELNLSSPSYVTEGDIEAASNSSLLYHCESNISSPDVTKFSTANGNNLSIISSKSFYNSLGSTQLNISKDNSRVFFREFLLDQDLNLMGSFQSRPGVEQTIFDSSNNSRLAIGFSHLFDVSTMKPIKQIRASYDFARFTGNDRGLLLVKNESPQYQVFKVRIYQYDL